MYLISFWVLCALKSWSKYFFWGHFQPFWFILDLFQWFHVRDQSWLTPWGDTLKLAPKKYFDQLLVKRSTRELVEIHNRKDTIDIPIPESAEWWTCEGPVLQVCADSHSNCAEQDNAKFPIIWVCMRMQLGKDRTCGFKFMQCSLYCELFSSCIVVYLQIWWLLRVPPYR